MLPKKAAAVAAVWLVPQCSARKSEEHEKKWLERGGAVAQNIPPEQRFIPYFTEQSLCMVAAARRARSARGKIFTNLFVRCGADPDIPAAFAPSVILISRYSLFVRNMY